VRRLCPPGDRLKAKPMADGPPSNRRVLVSVLEQYVAGEPVLSLSKEHPRTPGRTVMDSRLRIADLRFHLAEYDKIDGGSSS
jgi:hypothetical protein